MEEPTISTDSTVVISPRQASTSIDHETIILNFEEGFYYGLEDVGSRTWELLREPHTVAQLRDALVAAYAVEPDRCEADLQELLAQLAKAGLIDVTNERSE